MANNQFSKGDIVKSHHGKVLYEVVSRKNEYDLKLRSQNSGKLINYCYDYQYKLITSADAVEKERNMNKLYEFIHEGQKVFGTKLAVNSANQAVMEIKGQTAPVVIDPAALTEVMPYTVGIKAVKGNSSFYIESAKGKVKKDDLLIAKNGEFYTVSVVDAKKYASTGAPKITGRVLTESITL
jgi:hypothetical protein